ncbi:MAG: SGNH/GDSL hydrolase family protein [Planctomycetia bacterium]
MRFALLGTAVAACVALPPAASRAAEPATELREVDLAAVTFVNAAEVEKTAEGVIPLRFTRASLDALGNQMRPIARMATAVELQLKGTIRVLEVTARCRFADGSGVTAEWIRGPHKQLPTVAFVPDSREPQTFRFKPWGPLPETDVVRFVFPTHCELEILKVRVNADAKLEADFAPYDYRRLPDALGKRWLVHGDSITQGANVSIPTMTWVDLVARRLGLAATNLGIGGHGKAEPAMAADIAARTDFDILSLHVGTNAIWDKGYPERLEAFLKTILSAHPTKPVILASPILRFEKPGLPPAALATCRQAMADVAKRLAKDHPNLVFLPGEELIRRTASLNSDLIHIDDHGAIEYADNLAPVIARALHAR